MSNQNELKRLYRSQSHKIIGGVCAGVAQYLNIDPLIVRIVWLLACLFDGFGVLAYLVFLVLAPQNPDEAEPEPRKSDEKVPLYIGIALVVAGLFFLSHNLFDFFWFPHWPWFRFYFFDWELVWPVLLILFGAWFIWNGQRKDKVGEPAQSKTTSGAKELRRSRTCRMVAGVCGGLSSYWNVDVTLIRIAVVFAAILTSFWLAVIGYIIFMIAVPEEELA